MSDGKTKIEIFQESLAQSLEEHVARNPRVAAGLMNWYIHEEGKFLHPTLSDDVIHAVQLYNRKKHKEILKTWGNSRNVNEYDKDGNTLLFYAAAVGNKRLVAWLLKKKANINAVNSKNYNPLIYLITKLSKDNSTLRNKQVAVLELLIDNGIALECNDDLIGLNQTALCMAVVKQENEIAKFLVSKGADVNKADIAPPLYYAKNSNNLEMIEFLESQGAYEDVSEYSMRK